VKRRQRPKALSLRSGKATWEPSKSEALLAMTVAWEELKEDERQHYATLARDVIKRLKIVVP
jgi:hypothetical protein